MGYGECAKESIQTVGTRYSFEQEDISPIAVARSGESKDDPDRPGGRSFSRWLVYVDGLLGLKTCADECDRRQGSQNPLHLRSILCRYLVEVGACLD